MISRRQLRIKAFQSVYSFYKNRGRSIQNVEKELLFSVEKFYDLYFYLMLLAIDVRDYNQKIIDKRLVKIQATSEDLNPNLTLINNIIIKTIEDDINFKNRIEEIKISWNKYPALIKKTYEELIETDYFIEYMSAKKNTFEGDKEFMIYFFTAFLYNFEELFDTLEEQSIYWNGDIDFVMNSLGQIIKDIQKDKPETFVIPVVFKKNDDKEFLLDLFKKTLLNTKEYTAIIEECVPRWDVERISDTDRAILMLGICELTEFSSIPINVTFNEYIELGKLFGSTKSGSFINGVLEIIAEKLKSENKINKIGRGLIE